LMAGNNNVRGHIKQPKTDRALARRHTREQNSVIGSRFCCANKIREQMFA